MTQSDFSQPETIPPTLNEKTFTFTSPDGTNIFVRTWSNSTKIGTKGIVQIAHGMMEHSGRYRRLAAALTEADYLVYANDHRGHGNTAPSLDALGNVCTDALSLMVEDLHQLTQIIREQNQDLPIFLFGHSMGSFLAQKYICSFGNEIHGVILSGTSGKYGPIINLGIWLAHREMRNKGANWKSRKLHQLTFGGYNKKFVPIRTEYDWLSRDTMEVNRYMNDPLCGTLFSCQFYYDFMRFLKKLHAYQNISSIPKELPVFIFAGSNDPVSKNGKGILQLVRLYEQLGLKNISYKLYQDGRHEMLNETNRDEVTTDIISWLNLAYLAHNNLS